MPLLERSGRARSLRRSLMLVVLVAVVVTAGSRVLAQTPQGPRGPAPSREQPTDRSPTDSGELAAFLDETLARGSGPPHTSRWVAIEKGASA